MPKRSNDLQQLVYRVRSHLAAVVVQRLLREAQAEHRWFQLGWSDEGAREELRIYLQKLDPLMLRVVAAIHIEGECRFEVRAWPKAWQTRSSRGRLGTHDARRQGRVLHCDQMPRSGERLSCRPRSRTSALQRSAWRCCLSICCGTFAGLTCARLRRTEREGSERTATTPLRINSLRLARRLRTKGSWVRILPAAPTNRKRNQRLEGYRSQGVFLACGTFGGLASAVCPSCSSFSIARLLFHRPESSLICSSAECSSTI